MPARFARGDDAIITRQLLNMAPNLAHHHAKRLLDLGLLMETGREGGKVFYQLTAREFRVPSLLLPPDDVAGNGKTDMRELCDGFLQAYEQSWRTMHQTEEDIYGFGTPDQPALPLEAPTSPSLEAFPPHHQALTLRLTPERYQKLVRAIAAFLDDTYEEGLSKAGQHCTIALTAFNRDDGQPGDHLSMRLNSFLGAE